MPALIELLGGSLAALALLGACLAWAFSSGAIVVWGATFGRLARWLAGILPGAVHLFGKTIFPDLAKIVRDGNNAVLGYFQVWRAGAEDEIALSLHLLRLIFQANAEAVDWVARETTATFDWLEHVRVPRVIKGAAAAALPAALIAKLVASAVSRALAHLHGQVKVIVHDLPQVIYRYPRSLEQRLTHDEALLGKLAAGAGAIAGDVALPLPANLGHLRKEVTGLGRWAWRVNRRLSRVEAIFGATAIAAVLANLWGITPRCVRSGGPIGRLARSLCGIPSHLLNDLLGLLADVWLLENICVLLPLLETAASDIGTPLVEALTEVGAGLCAGNTAPAQLRGPAPQVPAAIFATVGLGV